MWKYNLKNKIKKLLYLFHDDKVWRKKKKIIKIKVNTILNDKY